MEKAKIQMRPDHVYIMIQDGPDGNEHWVEVSKNQSRGSFLFECWAAAQGAFRCICKDILGMTNEEYLKAAGLR